MGSGIQSHLSAGYVPNFADSVKKPKLKDPGIMGGSLLQLQGWVDRIVGIIPGVKGNIAGFGPDDSEDGPSEERKTVLEGPDT